MYFQKVAARSLAYPVRKSRLLEWPRYPVGIIMIKLPVDDFMLATSDPRFKAGHTKPAVFVAFLVTETLSSCTSSREPGG